GLAHDVGSDRAQDELLHADRNVLCDPLEDCPLVADGKVVCRIAVGTLGVGLLRCRHRPIAGTAKIESKARAVMIVIDRAASFLYGLLHCRNDPATISRHLAANL